MQKFQFTRRSFVLLAIITAGVIAPTTNAAVCASITNCTFNFNSTAVPQFGAGPYGTVNLALNNTFINITIDLASGFNLINTGTHQAFTFNTTLAGGVTLSNFSSSLYSQNTGSGPFPNSPFSDFDAAVKSTCTNGGGCGVNVLTFTVARPGGFTDVNQLVEFSTGTGIAAYFAADIANAAGNTGVVGVTGPPNNVVPEPISSALVGSGLIALFFMRRRASR